MQVDMFASWIVKDGERWFIQSPRYMLLFYWEASDFEDEVPYFFAKYLQKAGIKSEEEYKIPEGYKYLGRYDHLQEGDPELTGLTFDSEIEEGEVIAECMLS